MIIVYYRYMCMAAPDIY